LEYPEQLLWKARMVADALKRIGRVTVDLPVVERSPCEFRYRNRVTFTLRRSQGAPGGVVAGFHEIDEPDRVVDVTGACMLPEEAIAQVWDGLRLAWGDGAERLPAGTTLRLTLRSVTEGVVLIVDGGSGAWTPDALIQNVRGLVAVWHRGGNGPPLLMAGEASAGELWLGEPIQPGARAFTQVNRKAAERLQAAVMRAVGTVTGRTVVDAYCGVGVYGRALARAGARVSGIEIDPEAAAAAREDAPTGFRVIEGAVEDHLGEVLPADVVILNPPRAGVDNAVTRALSDRRTVKVVYVSCDSATLARDVGRLQGYRLTCIEAFDLFPQTAHVETLAVLECV
jgi:23S rRNA (uracil1939-C5)-methyltransferase